VNDRIKIAAIAGTLVLTALLGSLDPMAPQPPRSTVPIVQTATMEDEREQDGKIDEPLVGLDGQIHRDCWIVVPPGEDGYAQCKDGYIERP